VFCAHIQNDAVPKGADSAAAGFQHRVSRTSSITQKREQILSFLYYFTVPHQYPFDLPAEHGQTHFTGFSGIMSKRYLRVDFEPILTDTDDSAFRKAF